MAPPQVSVVLLTLNEERNIAACLASLANQTVRNFEVVVIDAASRDRTTQIVRDMSANFPVVLRLEASHRRLPIGEARNLGVTMAHADLVAFLSADAEPEPDWIEQGLRSMQKADMVFGRQVHAPHRNSFGASVRGLRYHFPTTPTEDPLRYASNVAALYRKGLLHAFPFDEWANAAEDLLLAKRAAHVGYQAAYNPDMVVRHHDVDSARQEMRKSVREGKGWAKYRAELGIFWQVLAWGALLLLLLGLLLVRPDPWLLGALLVVLWLPALVRAARRARDMPSIALVKGVLASPPFDLVFVANYIVGLLGRPAAAAPNPNAKETPR
jgi:glycosyltransferase involved in cell wall biosynthesis